MGATWRALTLADIPNLILIANACHPSLPESPSVFSERIHLYPSGCLALANNETDELFGYAISHPIRRRCPPALDSMLGAIPPDADQYYIHDVALLPCVRGRGFAKEGIKKLFAVAAGRYEFVSLVSVYGTAAFWSRLGFAPPRDVGEILRQKLVDYGADAVYLERECKM
jgi:ribosomal protein S18 acetylase RimI-like enzyme